MAAAAPTPAPVIITTGDKRNGIIVLIGLAAIGGVAYYFYNKGKEKPTTANLPSDMQSGGTYGNTPTNNAALRELASQIRGDIDGLNIFSSHDEVIYQRALSLSNTDFVQLYNIFNSLYQQEYKQTLTSVMNSEYAIPFSPFETMKQAMLSRLSSLDLA